MWSVLFLSTKESHTPDKEGATLPLFSILIVTVDIETISDNLIQVRELTNAFVAVVAILLHASDSRPSLASVLLRDNWR